MAKVRIKSPKVYEPPPNTWSQALRAGNHVYIAGQTAMSPKGKLVGKGDPLAQARQVFKNIRGLVEKAGGTMNDVVKINVYVTDIRNADPVRRARGAFFKGDFPTSTLVCVAALASPDFLVEIEAVAVLPD
ncbi:MAG: RidA family protein [Candidatus Tectomicrobia bacterium]|nr:RidA family protein [Candidatus Tectomicrobia bacterium]